MRKTIATVAAMAALAGCSMLESDAETEDEATEDTTEAEAEAEAEPETVMLPNGAPAYPGMDVSAAEVREPNGNSQSVNFETGADMFEVIDFYRTYYENDDSDISSLSLNARRRDTEDGGSVSISLNGQTGGSRVSVSPNATGGEFDLTKEYGNAFPAYPGVAEDALRVNEFDSGRRSISFETDDAPIEVFNYYRNAFQEAQLEFGSAQISARSRQYRRSANISASSRYNATGSRVYTSVNDPMRASQAAAAGDSDASK